MFKHVNLEYDYSNNGFPDAEVTKNLVTGYDQSVNVTTYTAKFDNHVVTMLVYSTGLVFFADVYPGRTVIRTNREFKPGDDGNLHLVDA
ncbi:hypothetical protein AOT41_04005 [Limosilactobacillus fermentum]|nr:hypothetical protein [Limosilactobacillus fermentum]KLD54772.1 hypothetical protein WU68_05755 [Limosilactobacillus fermentum]KPH23096.1 hypothetical protein AOT41_04005 [Limosilactobacillus fermentum]